MQFAFSLMLNFEQILFYEYCGYPCLFLCKLETFQLGAAAVMVSISHILFDLPFSVVWSVAHHYQEQQQ
jgi:hypothetical protein